MYVGINDYTLNQLGFPGLKDGLDAIGVKAVEVSFNRDLTVRGVTADSSLVTLDGPDAIAEYERRLDDHGIRLAALMLSNNFNADDLETELAWVERAIRTAHRLGCSAVRLDAIMKGEREMAVSERVRKTVDAVTRLLESTGDVPIPLGLENHGACGNDPEYLEAVLDAVPDRRFGLTLDTANLYWWGQPLTELYRLYERLAPRVVHTHLKSINYPVDDRDRKREIGWKYGEYASPLPDGNIEFPRLMGWLRAAGYDGALCIEDESLGKFDQAGKIRALQRDADYAARLIAI